MFGKFLPKTVSFYDDFDLHVSIIDASARELLAMVSIEEDLQASAQRISFLEKDADQIARRCLKSLHMTFITPFERDDIYKLITQMDDIIDDIEDISARIIVYKLTVMTETLKSMALVLSSAVKEVVKLVRSLRKLDDIESMHQTFIRIHDYEHEADSILRVALGQLFAEEKDPIALIKLKEIYELLESAVDRCEDVANIIENVLIEHA